jgi:hypothetical protein
MPHGFTCNGYRGYSRCRLFLWRNFFNERLTMDQRDDDPMLEINGRIKALIVEAMKANKGADPHDLLAEIVGKLSFREVPDILWDYVHNVLHQLIDPECDEEARPH